MSLNQGPAIDCGEVSRRPLFSLRMIHSGYGLDEYPDEHLKAIAHAGMDTILIFTYEIKCLGEMRDCYYKGNKLLESIAVTELEDMINTYRLI